MKNIHALLHGLSKTEQELLKQHISIVSNNHKGKENKMLKLALFLLDCKHVPGNTECLEGVYGKGSNGKKIFNLAKRLRIKVHELVITDQVLDHHNWLDKQDILSIKVKKKIAQFQALHFSGHKSEISLDLLDDTIEICKEYEYYSNLVECLKLKKMFIGFRMGEKEFEAIVSDITFYDNYNRVLNKVVDTYLRIIMKNDFSSATRSKEKFRSLVLAINSIKKDLQHVRSATAEYYLKLLEMDCFQEKGEYLKARSICLQLITIVRANKSVFRKSRISMAYGNLSRCELYLKKYESAIEYAREAQKHLPEGSANFAVSLEQEFYALFYSGNYSKAHKLARHLVDGSQSQVGDFRHDKYRFYLSCTLFKENKYNQALTILHSYQEIARDKAGWEMAIRLLRIMCYIEIGNLDGAILQIDSLRKHLGAHSSKSVFANRYQVILRLLQQFEKEGFNSKRNDPKIKDLLALLRSSGTFYSWEMLGPELVPFHEWFIARMPLVNRKTLVPS
jgi:tetratricopeptide (TPR) repeat protein